MSSEPKATPFLVGKLVGVVYTYEKVDDTLPIHVHDKDNNHITIIMNGSFRCIGHEKVEGMFLYQGQVIAWPPNQPHGFVALEPLSRMLQIST